MNDVLTIGNKEFHSRLIVGSGKYKDFQTTREATLASGAEMITVAVRRVNILNKDEENLLDYFKDTNGLIKRLLFLYQGVSMPKKQSHFLGLCVRLVGLSL